jgi:hypothetical protein
MVEPEDTVPHAPGFAFETSAGSMPPSERPTSPDAHPNFYHDHEPFVGQKELPFDGPTGSLVASLEPTSSARVGARPAHAGKYRRSRRFSNADDKFSTVDDRETESDITERVDVLPFRKELETLAGIGDDEKVARSVSEPVSRLRRPQTLLGVGPAFGSNRPLTPLPPPGPASGRPPPGPMPPPQSTSPSWPPPASGSGRAAMASSPSWSPRGPLQPDPADWDEDEDEVTSIFDKSKAMDVFRSMGPVGPRPAAGAPAGVNRTPQSLPPPAQYPSGRYPPPVSRSGVSASGRAAENRISTDRVSAEPPRMYSEPPSSGRLESALPESMPAPDLRSNRGLLVLTAAIAVLAVALVAYRFWPRNGALMVTVWGPNHAGVDMLEVRVDDRLVCSKAPCAVPKLNAGRPHTVSVVAPGYIKSATRAAEVEAGKVTLVEFELSRATTGVRVGALAPNLRLFVDGSDRGPLPASIEDLKPGSHSIRIDGNDRYRPYEEQITLTAGELKTLEPKLKVAKALAKLEPGPNLGWGRVWLVCAGERRVDLRLPTVREVAVDQGCRVEAYRAGFESASVELAFEDSSEKTFTIDLTPAAGRAGAAPAAARRPRSTSVPAVAARTTAPAVAARTTAPAPAAAPAAPARPAAVASGPTGFIAINSIPVSSVTVDGRPSGQTPVRVSVPAGNHMVVFSHAEKGQKALRVNVKAGATSPRRDSHRKETESGSYLAACSRTARSEPTT